MYPQAVQFIGLVPLSHKLTHHFTALGSILFT